MTEYLSLEADFAGAMVTVAEDVENVERVVRVVVAGSGRGRRSVGSWLQRRVSFRVQSEGIVEVNSRWSGRMTKSP